MRRPLVQQFTEVTEVTEVTGYVGEAVQGPSVGVSVKTVRAITTRGCFPSRSATRPATGVTAQKTPST